MVFHPGIEVLQGTEAQVAAGTALKIPSHKKGKTLEGQVTVIL